MDFCRFCVVISIFSSPPQRPMTSDFEGFSIPDFIHDIFFPILILQKEPVFSLFECWVPKTGTTGTILKRLWYDAALDWGLNPGPPALEASTLPLGYWRGDIHDLNSERPYDFSNSFGYKLTPQLIKFNTLTHDWIPHPALWGIGVFSLAW